MQCLQPEYERTWHRAPLSLVFRLHLTMPRHECDNRGGETLHQYLAFLDVDQSIGIGDLTCSDFPAGGGGDNHNLEFPPGAL
jgi:hypothetical protein